MRHGLGDAAQFCIVLKHLHKYRPNWNITVECGYGKDTCFTGMCDKIHISSSPNFTYDWANNGKLDSEDDYDQTFDFYWFEASEGASDKCLTHKVPATKVTKALTEVFHIEPDPELFEYPKIPIPSHNDSAAEKYIKKLPPHKCVGIHYQGNTSSWNKNIDDDIMRHICNFITRDFADNVLHMLPKDAIKNIHARDIKSVNKFFQDNYHHKYYGNLKKDLMDAICKHLGLKETDEIKTVTSVVENDPLALAGSKNQAVTSVVENDTGSKNQAVTSVVENDPLASKDSINQVAYSARKRKIVEKRNRKTASLHNEGKQTVTKIGKWWALGPKKPILS
jgi:hypothetical protein